MKRSKSNVDRTFKGSDIIRLRAKHNGETERENGCSRTLELKKHKSFNSLGKFVPDEGDIPVQRRNKCDLDGSQKRKSEILIGSKKTQPSRKYSFRATLAKLFLKSDNKHQHKKDDADKDDVINKPDVAEDSRAASEATEFEKRRQFWTSKERIENKSAPKLTRSWKKESKFCERSVSYEFLPQPNDLLSELKIENAKTWRKRETVYFNDEDDENNVQEILKTLTLKKIIPEKKHSTELKPKPLELEMNINKDNSEFMVSGPNSREPSSSPDSHALNSAYKEFDRAMGEFKEIKNYHSYEHRKRDQKSTQETAKQNRLSVSLASLPLSVVSSEASVVPSQMKKCQSAMLNSVLQNQMSRNKKRLSVTLDTFQVSENFKRLSGNLAIYPAMIPDIHPTISRWISPEESAIYSRDQNPPFIIPRLKSSRPRYSSAENEGTPSSAKRAGVGETAPANLQVNFGEPKSPTIKDVRKMFEDKGVSLLSNESPKFGRVNKWTGGSNEVLSPKVSGIHKTPEQQAIELRHRDLESLTRTHGKVKSMVTGTQWKALMMPPRVLPRDYEPTDHVLFEGPANRTRLTENGKKVRKNWQTNYLALTQTSLAFYKDIKGYHAMRLAGPIGTPPASTIVPELIFSLAGALISTSTPQHTRRANAYVITSVKHHQVIIQHDEPAIAKKWFDAILRAINKLPSDYTCPDNSMAQSPLTTPSPVQKRIPRSKSSSKVPESSMEDLSDPTEQSKIRSKLKKFFVRRPTMESLVKKGIYKDEPVFGQSLEEVCPKMDPRIPEFVARCVAVIESTEENMTSDGLYRASGNLSQVQKIRLEVDQNNLSILDKEVDVHVLTGALKLFFRELKEPLIPYRLFQRALDASANRVYESKIKEFREIVNSLPECNKQTLMFLLKHLLRVTDFKDKNRMHVANLAIVLGPTLLWAPSEAAHNIAVDCLQQNQVIETFLADYERIFKEEGRRK